MKNLAKFVKAQWSSHYLSQISDLIETYKPSLGKEKYMLMLLRNNNLPIEIVDIIIKSYDIQKEEEEAEEAEEVEE